MYKIGDYATYSNDKNNPVTAKVVDIIDKYWLSLSNYEIIDIRVTEIKLSTNNLKTK